MDREQFKKERGELPDVCYGCAERHFRCHETCEKYLTAKKEYAASREAVAEAKKTDNVMDSYYAAAIKRQKKRNSRMSGRR